MPFKLPKFWLKIILNEVDMIRIGLLGYSGRMGQAIANEIAAVHQCQLAGGVVRTLKPDTTTPSGALLSTNVDDVLAVSDVVIDFTLPEATTQYARSVAAYNKPLVCGTTGLNTDTLQVLKQLSAKIPVLYAPNTSMSLAAMKQLTSLAAKLLGDLDYDVAIIDEHHRMKKDSPSGTALALGKAVQEGNHGSKQPSYAAIRAGHIVGNHEVIFTGNGETIRLHHSVTDRRIFARGAVQAAVWLHNKPPGYYSMSDVLGI